MLPGAYSNRFKGAEKQHVDHLRYMEGEERSDMIARNHRLRQETNRRRKAIAIKRKHELLKEERRRQDILTRRKEEIRQATERYQRQGRVHSRTNSGDRGMSPEPAPNLEDALQAVWGDAYGSPDTKSAQYGSSYRYRHSPVSRQSSASSSSLRQGSFVLDRQGSAGSRKGSAGVPRQGSASRIHADLQNRSLTNLNSSRSLFEQQLQQQQQLLLSHQRQALDHFNAAIAEELDKDKKLQGEERDPEDDEIDCCDSVSSVDSLEEVAPRRRNVIPQSQADKDDGFRSSGSTSSLLHSSLSSHSNVAVVAPSVVTSPTNAQTHSPQNGLKPEPQQAPTNNNLKATAVITHQQTFQLKDQNHGPGHHTTVVNHMQVDNQNQWIPNQMNIQNTDPKMVTPQVPSGGATWATPSTQQQVSSSKSAWVLHDTSPSDVYSQQHSMPSTNASPYTGGTHVQSDSNTPNNYPTSQANGHAVYTPQGNQGNGYATTKANGYTATPATPQANSYVAPQAYSAPQTNGYAIPQGQANSQTNGYATPQPNHIHSAIVGQRTSVAPSNSRPSETASASHQPAPDHVILKNNKPAIAENSYSSIQAAMQEGQKPPAEKPQPYVGQSKAVTMTTTSAATSISTFAAPQFKVAPPEPKLPRPVKTTNTEKPKRPSSYPRRVPKSLTYCVPDDHSSSPKKEVRSILKKLSPQPRGRVGLKGMGYSRGKVSVSTTPVSASVRDSLEITREHLGDRQLSRKKRVRWVDMVCEEEEEPEEQIEELEDDVIQEEAGEQSESSEEEQEEEQRPPVPPGPPRTATRPPQHPAKTTGIPSRVRPASARVPASTTTQDHTPTKGPRVSSAGSLRRGPFLRPHPPTQPPSGRACMNRHPAWKGPNNAGDAAGNVTKPMPVTEAVYDNNGIRLDRTPTDDEINWLWDKVRTCLSRESQSQVTTSQVSFGSGVDKRTHQQQVSHQHIDGNSLAPQFGVSTRISSAQHAHTHPVANSYLPRKVSADSLNSYTKRMSLLQQRKQQSQQRPSSHTVTTTTYQPMHTDNAAMASHSGPTPSSVAPTPSIATMPQDDVSASMAAFLTAEALSKHSMADSDIEQAMDMAQLRQHTHTAGRPSQKVPSALSIEEQRLMQSLERLNERLKLNEIGASAAPGAFAPRPPTYDMCYILQKQGSFKGHAPLTVAKRQVNHNGTVSRHHYSSQQRQR